MTIIDNQRVSSISPPSPPNPSLTSASNPSISPSLRLSTSSSSLNAHQNASDLEQKHFSERMLKTAELPEDLSVESEFQKTHQHKIQQQREARRRKILNNAKSRLERLNGLQMSSMATTSLGTTDSNKDHNENFCSLNQYLLKEERCSDPEVEPDQPIFFNHNANFQRDVMSQHHQSFGISNFLEILFRTQLLGASSSIQGSQSPNYSDDGTKAVYHSFFATWLVYYRFHMMISAVLSLAMLVAWPPVPMKTINQSHVLLPVGLCVLVDLFLFFEQRDMNPLLKTFLLMMGLRARWIKMFYQLYSIFCNIIIDFSVFLLSFVALSLTLAVFSNDRYGDLIMIP